MLADKNVLLGNSDFLEIIRNDAFFVDKSMFIKEFVELGCQVQILMRPRGFGKSTNLSMLRSFLSRGANPEHFKNLAIYKDREFVDAHCGKYTVLYLDLKDCKGTDFEDMKKEIWNRVGKMYSDQYDEISDSEPEFDPCTKAWLDLPVPSRLKSYLKRLMTKLYEKYDSKVIVLIDSYDDPQNNAAKNGIHSEVANFFDYFLTTALKDNKALKKAFLMGVTDVLSYGDFDLLARLNNAITFVVTDKHYSQHFGFSPEEISPFAGESLNDIIAWYGGYTIAGNQMVNPWSFSSWMANRDLKPYWVQSGNSHIIDSLVFKYPLDILYEMIRLFLKENYCIPVIHFSPKSNFGHPGWSSSRIWHYLILTGYLSYRKIDQTMSAVIPNDEMRVYWQATMKSVLLGEEEILLFGGLPEAFENFDLSAIHDLFQQVFSYPSYQEFRRQNYFNLLIAGIITFLPNDPAMMKISFIGKSVTAIAIEFLKAKKAVFLKINSIGLDSVLQSDAKISLKELMTTDFVAGFKAYDCLLIGVAFNKEKVSELESAVIKATI